MHLDPLFARKTVENKILSNDGIVHNTILMEICIARRSRGKGKGQGKEGTVSGRALAWGLRLLERLLKVLTSRHKF